ncbi:MAG: DUF1465 family protein [Alphaproteobacteria bacterium]
MHVPASSPFFQRAYDEAFGLLVEARNYVAYRERLERERLSIVGRLTMSCEAMRVTSRLTSVMAWLLTQRAVQSGEISLEEACSEDNRLTGEQVCLLNESVGNETLPQGLRSLLERSYNLYVRIQHLEDLVRQQVAH